MSRKLEPVNPIEIRSNLKNEDQIQNENRMTSQICIGDLRKTASKVKVRLKIRKVTNLKSLKDQKTRVMTIVREDIPVPRTNNFQNRAKSDPKRRNLLD